MNQEQRNHIKEDWFKGVSTIRETGMPNDARFFVGQVVVHDGRYYEIVGFYDYYGTTPMYLTVEISEGGWYGSTIGIPFAVQGEMYLKSEEYLHKRAKIIRMDYK